MNPQASFALTTDDDHLFAEFLGVIATRLAHAARHDQELVTPIGGRHWRKLASTMTYDAWLVAWAAGSGLPEHDHDGSTAAFRVIRGELVERLSQRGRRVRLRVLGAGGIATVLPGQRHAVTNSGIATATSIHVYSPPLGDAWRA